jgi:uncharacterized membrane protein YbhN (UPF0104 family)
MEKKMKVLKVIGGIATLVSFYFIFKIISKLKIDFSVLLNIRTLFFVFLFSLIFSLSIFILSFSWKLILQFISKKKIPFWNIFLVYARSNIGKYLPGNFMHLANRNLIGDNLSLKQSEIALSSFLEIIFMIISTLILSLSLSFEETIRLLSQKLNVLTDKWLFFILFSVILVISGVVLFVFIFKKNLVKLYHNYVNMELVKLFFNVFILNVLCFAVLGVILILIIKFLLNTNITNIKNIFNIQSIFVFSWLAGFITPGSPGGIGVREFFLISLLSKYISPETVVISVTLHRLISIFGDIITFLFSFYKKI